MKKEEFRAALDMENELIDLVEADIAHLNATIKKFQQLRTKAMDTQPARCVDAAVDIMQTHTDIYRGLVVDLEKIRNSDVLAHDKIVKLFYE